MTFPAPVPHSVLRAELTARRLAELHAAWPLAWSAADALPGDCWEAELGDWPCLVRVHCDAFGWTAYLCLFDGGAEVAVILGELVTLAELRSNLANQIRSAAAWSWLGDAEMEVRR